MRKIKEKTKQSEKGAITLFVLVAMLFFTIILILIFSGKMNKIDSQKKQIEKIQEEYSVESEMDEVYNKEVSKVPTQSFVKVGDYVAYDPTIVDKTGTKVEANQLTYLSPIGGYSDTEGIITHGNGNSEQTFTAKANDGTATGLKWKVLSVSGDKVELIADSVVQTDEGNNFVLKGGIAYLYAEQELNEVCKIYGYGYGADTSVGATYTVGGPEDTQVNGKIEGTGARSITIDDLNKIAGIYKDTTDGTMKYSDGTVIADRYGSISTIEAYYPTLSSRNTTYPGQSTSKKSGFKYTFYYWSKTKIADTNMQDILFNGKYWLASRCINTGTNFTEYRVCYVVGDNAISNALCSDNDDFGSCLAQHSYTFFAVRPVVTLKSNVIDISTPYDESTGWSLK